MTIKIEVRNVYGTNKAYPICARAAQFAAIAGTKTLTPATLRRVLALGEDVEVIGGPFVGCVIRGDAPVTNQHGAVNALALSAN